MRSEVRSAGTAGAPQALREASQRVAEALTTLLIPAGACMLGVFALHKFMEIRPRDPLSTVQDFADTRLAQKIS